MKTKIFSRIIIGMMCFASISSIILADERADFSAQKICKAAIGQIMGKNPKIINTYLAGNSIVQLSYIRENDGTKWSYRCKVEGNKIIWASETGRWRDHPLDPKLTYSISGRILHIEEDYGDGSSTKQKFNLNQLNK